MKDRIFSMVVWGIVLVLMGLVCSQFYYKGRYDQQAYTQQPQIAVCSDNDAIAVEVKEEIVCLTFEKVFVP